MKNLIMLLFLGLIVSCGKSEQSGEEPAESMSKGEITIVCDEAIKHVMDPAIDMYDAKYKDVKVSKEFINARGVMQKLLSGEARLVINSRDYLRDEDSLMKAYGMEPHKKMAIASDGLVFFTQRNFPTDTLSVEEIEAALTSGLQLKSIYNMAQEPKFAFPDVNSSVYYHLYKQAAKEKSITRSAEYFKDTDSLIQYVKNNNAVGVALMSQVTKDTTLKMLRLGFTNKDKKRIYPQTVHPGYIVQDMYPFKITYYAYLKEQRRNLPFWFARYLEQDREAQKYFLDAGILPEYAKLVLKQN